MDYSCNKTIHVTLDNWGATFSEITKCPPPEWLPLMIIGSLLFGCTAAMFGWLVRDFYMHRWSHPKQLQDTCLVLSFYLVHSGCYLLNMINPRGGHIYEFISDVYEAIGLTALFNLSWFFSSGRYPDLKGELDKRRINLGQFPFPFLKLCSQLTKPTEKFFTVVLCLMVQLPIIQFILGVITISSWYNGSTSSSYYGDTTSTRSMVASVILLVSFKFSIYAIHLQDATLRPYYIGRRFFKLKFYLFKALTILTKVQFSILGAVLEYGSDQPDSFGFVSGTARAEIWVSFLVLIECLLLLLIASFVFTRRDFISATQDGLPGGNTYTDLPRASQQQLSNLHSSTGGRPTRVSVSPSTGGRPTRVSVSPENQKDRRHTQLTQI